ncbi:MAG: hypothetical protein ACI9G1_004408 [Pirellulaceae bacterium]|jgi:hypothetical protein
MNQSIRVIVFGTLLMACSTGTMLVLAETPKAAAEREAAELLRRRLREGDEIEDRAGYFKENADRLLFILTDTESPQTFRVLENLALERISRVMDAKPGKREWSVSGKITEYRGNYYILLTRAILKSKRFGQ